MRKIIIFIFLAISANIYGQRIVSRTKLIKKHLEHHLDLCSYTDNTETYKLWVVNPQMKPVPTKSICVSFGSKDDVIRTLQFLYNLKEDDGTFIDLENLSHNTALTSGKNHYLISAPDQIDNVYIDKKSIGHFLNALGISVNPEKEKNDDLYNKGDDLY